MARRITDEDGDGDQVLLSEEDVKQARKLIDMANNCHNVDEDMEVYNDLYDLVREWVK